MLEEEQSLDKQVKQAYRKDKQAWFKETEQVDSADKQGDSCII